MPTRRKSRALYRVQKIAPDPRKVRGYRTIREGTHEVRIALLPGGGTRAVSILHPKGEKR